MNWWNYCNSNPLTFLDFNGLQSIYLPGGGTTFNGPCPGMKYNMETYSKECDAVGDFVDGISSNAKGLAVIIDKVFLNKKVNLDKSLQINVENVEIKKQNETNGEN